jgi:alpha-tubulin suppressor-like RCC1 family protein
MLRRWVLGWLVGATVAGGCGAGEALPGGGAGLSARGHGDAAAAADSAATDGAAAPCAARGCGNFCGTVGDGCGHLLQCGSCPPGQFCGGGGQGLCGGNSGATGAPDAGTDAAPVVPVTVSAGLYSTCALLSNETVKCWGYNMYGQLGDATETNSLTPVTVQGLNDAVSISAQAGYHACAVLADGQAQCWGSNYGGDFGNGSDDDSSSIKTVQGLSTLTAISTGANYTCAVQTDGTVFCWGETPAGTGGSTTPALVPLQDVVSIQTGTNDVCALRADGTVHCWGNNVSGQIGDGTSADALSPEASPTEVVGLRGAVAIAVGQGQACAVLADRTVVCWGDNTHGELGIGTVNSDGPPYGSATPLAVPGLTDVQALTLAGDYACALLSQGTVVCWGDNQYGTLGNGTTTDAPSPAMVPGLTDVVAISAGTEHACALERDGSIWCWGLNTEDELGHAATGELCNQLPCSTTPVAVTW